MSTRMNGPDHHLQDVPGFEFVLVKQPTAGPPKDVRKRVRSHVTKLQHQRTRETTGRPRAEPRRPSAPKASRAAAQSLNLRRKLEVLRAGKLGDISVVKDTGGRRDRKDDERRGDLLSVLRRTSTSPKPTNAMVIPRSQLGVAFSQGTMAFRTFALDDATNTVGMSLKALGLDTSSVLACYRFVVQIQARDFEQQYCMVQRHTVWERFYSFIFRDPVLLTVALLITIRYRLEATGDRIPEQDFLQVLKLEDFLIRRVNAALQDPGRAVSDPMLVAVALCASYEVKNGNPQAYHIHMKGLVQMIQMRGGLAAVGAADPYLERMLVWNDVNTAVILGHDGYLAHMSNSMGIARPESNLKTFITPIEQDAREAVEDVTDREL